jgi:hypothetical protein
VTLQLLAEGFLKAGVPVFAADIKGDLSGIGALGKGQEPFIKRAKDIGVDYAPDQFPVVFWDLLGEQGHRLRTTISDMGPLLVARLLDLNEVQEGTELVGWCLLQCRVRWSSGMPAPFYDVTPQALRARWSISQGAIPISRSSSDESEFRRRTVV